MKEVFDFKIHQRRESDSFISRYKTLYMFYHKLYTCYKWKYKKLKKIRLLLHLGGIGLTIIGTIAGGVTLNPIVLGCVSGPGLLMQGYKVKSNLDKKVESCRFAYTRYKKILNQLKSYFDGLEFDETIFLSDTKLINDMVIDMCPTINGVEVRYYETYNIV